jgi:hypothetical protein
MDASKMNKVNKITSEITKAVAPLGVSPDFFDLKDGKGPDGFRMTVSFGPKGVEDKTGDMFAREHPAAE